MLSKVKLVFILEAKNELPKQRNRVHWVHPFSAEAKGEKCFRKIYENVRNFETKFFGYYRMSFKSFDDLLIKIKYKHKISNKCSRKTYNNYKVSKKGSWI